MTDHRLERLSDSIRSTLGDLLLLEVRDPRLRLATVSKIDVTRDLQVATVYVAFSDPEQDREDCLEALQGAAGFLRHQLSQRLSLRHTPELRFRIDRGAEYSERIESLLQSVDLQRPDDVDDLTGEEE